MEVKNHKEHRNTQIIGLVVLGLFGLAIVLAVAGMSNTIGKIDDVVISRTPDAILASAGVADKSDISLPVAYFDQRADECVNMYDTNKVVAVESRQFEWSRCGYQRDEVEQGLVDYYLDEKLLPVATGAGILLPNRGLGDFDRWYNNVDGKSKSYIGSIDLAYDSSATEFRYFDEKFYPLDSADFSKDDFVNKDGHNHLFTMNFAIPFMVLKNSEEKFEITADDDTFVYVGNELAVDMGGIHGATTGKIEINDDGEVLAGVGDEEMAYTGIKLENDADAIVRIFHADRDSKGSVFGIVVKDVSVNVVKSQLADGGGVQVAYDPTDPSYVAPLGETLTVRPSGTKAQIIMATIFGVVIVVGSVLAVMLTRRILRNRK